MRRFPILVLLSLLLVGSTVPVWSYTVQLTDASGSMQIRWAGRKIPVALSTSLTAPGPQIKTGSDVLGAARRAMSRWASLGNVQFLETSSKAQSISPAAGGDGISLITIADTVENSALFTGSTNTGRTRVFFDPATGIISEADIVINPHPVSADGTPVQFSTDGTPGTYDLESALTHELGHLLGLEHSGVIASTMQARQGLNGLYKLSSTTNRTLSEDDRAAVRGLYGPREGLGAVEGRIQNSAAGSPAPVFGAHVWAESFQTGRVIASGITLADGTYHIEGLPPGQYRVIAGYLDGAVMAADIASSGGAYAGMVSQAAFRSEELAAQLNVNPGAPTTLNKTLVPPQNTAPALKPRLLGINAQLSSVAIPVEAGRSYTIYIGGEGVDQVPGNAINVSSPFIAVSPASLTLQQFGTSFPVISFEVTVAANAPFGDYSIRLQANSGEVGYLVGGLTVDPGVNVASSNPEDDSQFFVQQQYRDFLARDADEKGLEYWTSQLAMCGVDAACLRDQRIDVSAAFFAETEFQETGAFVYRLYKSALGRQPTFLEFSTGRKQVAADANLEANKVAFTRGFSERGEFMSKYPQAMSADKFVDTLLATVARHSQVDLSAQRSQLLARYEPSSIGRTLVIREVAENEVLARAEFNEAFVLMQYFGYLRRDPDQRGYKFWLNVLNSKPANEASVYRSMVCSFVNSIEYQARFGMMITHTNTECAP